MHSKIKSFKFRERALGIRINWMVMSLFVIGVLGIGTLLIYFNIRTKNYFLTYVVLYVIGSIVSFVFGVIVLNELFYLSERLRKKVWKSVRICDIISLTISVFFVVLVAFAPYISSNYIFSNILSIIILIGAIKLFKFLNLKQAAICCLIVFIVENTVAFLFNYFSSDMSYNDLIGTTFNSPLVMEVTNFTYNLYRKCSWIPISEIILPGITIAFLRRYDYSRDSKLYLVISNCLFIVSVVVWTVIQSVTVFSIPFALITYPFLFIPIFVIAYQRDELDTLLYAKFY